MFLSLSLGRFYGIDSLIELLIIIVAGIISLYSHKIYKIVKEENYRYFSWAFLSIAISYFFKILSNFTIINRMTVEKANFIYIFTTPSKYMPIIDFFSFTFYKIFLLIGFLMMFLVLTKSEKKENVFLFVYLSIIAILFSIYFNFIFFMTVLLILILLTVHFYHNYKNHRTIYSLLVYLGFAIVAVCHLLFIFSDVHSLFYIIGEGLLLIGFMCLLINHIKIKLYFKENSAKQQNSQKSPLKIHPKKSKRWIIQSSSKKNDKENKTRSNKGHSGNTSKKQAS